MRGEDYCVVSSSIRSSSNLTSKFLEIKMAYVDVRNICLEVTSIVVVGPKVGIGCIELFVLAAYLTVCGDVPGNATCTSSASKASNLKHERLS